MAVVALGEGGAFTIFTLAITLPSRPRPLRSNQIMGWGEEPGAGQGSWGLVPGLGAPVGRGEGAFVLLGPPHPALSAWVVAFPHYLMLRMGQC